MLKELVYEKYANIDGVNYTNIGKKRFPCLDGLEPNGQVNFSKYRCKIHWQGDTNLKIEFIGTYIHLHFNGNDNE